MEADFDEYKEKLKAGYIPLKIWCELDTGASAGEENVCLVDKDGFGSCGDRVIDDLDKGYLCCWVYEVLEWQEGERYG